MEVKESESKKYKPYSFDWWWEKGYEDYPNFRDPRHPKVKPYIQGWLHREDNSRNSWGSVDFIND